MEVIDVINPQRVNSTPHKTVTLMSNGKFVERGYTIKNVSLNQYIQRKDRIWGPYSVLTAHVETDKGSIEITYDEGYRGEHALEEAVAFLTSHLGISALIFRSIIQLENSVK